MKSFFCMVIGMIALLCHFSCERPQNLGSPSEPQPIEWVYQNKRFCVTNEKTENVLKVYEKTSDSHKWILKTRVSLLCKESADDLREAFIHANTAPTENQKKAVTLLEALAAGALQPEHE